MPEEEWSRLPLSLKPPLGIIFIVGILFIFVEPAVDLVKDLDGNVMYSYGDKFNQRKLGCSGPNGRRLIAG